MYLDAAAKPDPAYVAFDPVAGHAVMTGSFTEITDANQLALYKAGGGVIGDGHKLFVADIAAYKSAITTPLDSYANAISGTAFTFAAFLFASMITTTVFAYKKRRGGNK